MVDEQAALPPPLEGCLYCHSESSTALIEPRRFLGFGGLWPLLKCKHCGSVAQIDLAEDSVTDWRIRYRRVNHSPRYYYVRLRFGKAGWLSASQALHLSTEGYVQRRRVQQAEEGDLGWLQLVHLQPPPPLMSSEESIFLSLRAVTYQEAPPAGLFVRPEQGKILDSGKFYVTDEKLYLLGQRRDWAHSLHEIEKVEYNESTWIVYLNHGGELYQYRGVNVSDQFDAQLVAAIIQALYRIHNTLRQY